MQAPRPGRTAYERPVTMRLIRRPRQPKASHRSWPEALVRDFSAPAAWAGLTTFLWYAVGMVPVQIAVVTHFGLDHAQVSSWMFIIWFTGAISSIILSLVYRQPLAMTSSLAAIIFLGTLAGRFSFEEVAGANLLAGLLVLALGGLGIGRRLLVWLPLPLAMGMLAGSILTDVLNVVTATLQDTAVAGTTVAGYLVGRALRSRRVPPLSLALLAGGAAVVVMHGAAPASVDWTLPSLVVPQMQFSLSSFLAISLPLVVLSIGLGNVQGLGYLAEQGYRVPANQVTMVLGISSIVNAIFGGHTAQVSRNGIPIMASPEAGSAHTRYWASLLAAGAMLLIALAAAPVTSLAGILPRGYIVALAGLAILPSLQDALERAFNGTLRFGAVVAFLVAATPFSILGVTSGFWAMLAGLGASLLAERAPLLAHWRGESLAINRRQEPRLPVLIRPDSAVRLAGTRRVAIRAVIRNISAHGLLVHSEQPLLPGTQLEFGFRTHGGGAELRLRAHVRHVQHHLQLDAPELWEAGCEFRESDPEREQLIRLVLQQQQTGPVPAPVTSLAAAAKSPTAAKSAAEPRAAAAG